MSMSPLFQRPPPQSQCFPLSIHAVPPPPYGEIRQSWGFEQENWAPSSSYPLWLADRSQPQREGAGFTDRHGERERCATPLVGCPVRDVCSVKQEPTKACSTRLWVPRQGRSERQWSATDLGLRAIRPARRSTGTPFARPAECPRRTYSPSAPWRFSSPFATTVSSSSVLLKGLVR